MYFKCALPTLARVSRTRPASRHKSVNAAASSVTVATAAAVAAAAAVAVATAAAVYPTAQKDCVDVKLLVCTRAALLHADMFLLGRPVSKVLSDSVTTGSLIISGCVVDGERDRERGVELGCVCGVWLLVQLCFALLLMNICTSLHVFVCVCGHYLYLSYIKLLDLFRCGGGASGMGCRCCQGCVCTRRCVWCHTLCVCSAEGVPLIHPMG